jgi:hypothetical protein
MSSPRRPRLPRLADHLVPLRPRPRPRPFLL